MSELLDAALHISQDLGYYIFPCWEKLPPPYLDVKSGKWKQAGIKSPKNTGGFHNASIDKEQIKKWWSNGWSESCIGFSTHHNCFGVIDVDTKNVDGIGNYHKLGISDSGAWHGFSANNGLHIYFDDHQRLCKTTSNEKTGIDTRGQGGYIIVAPSYIYDENGNKKYYKMLDDMSVRPKEMTIDILERLGQIKKQKQNRGKYVDNRTADDKLKQVIRDLKYLPEDFSESYDKWVSVGMSLFELGEKGFEIWSDWTDSYFEKKPNSKRRGTLERHWESFKTERDDKLTPNYISYWAKKGRE